MTTTQLLIESPVGPLRLFADGDELAGVDLPGTADGDANPWAPVGSPAVLAGIARRAPVLDETARQLAEYFAGTRRVFDLPIAPRGSGFQERVWRALLAIPFGVTWSYGEIARAIGRPAASRAVGSANARNPISIIVPCHRVIGASGALTGYAGGLATKRWLLDHERRIAGAQVGETLELAYASS